MKKLTIYLFILFLCFIQSSHSAEIYCKDGEAYLTCQNLSWQNSTFDTSVSVISRVYSSKNGKRYIKYASGILIDSYTVLTSAHAVTSDQIIEQTIVLPFLQAEQNQIQNETPSFIEDPIEVEQIIIHPQYEWKRDKNNNGYDLDYKRRSKDIPEDNFQKSDVEKLIEQNNLNQSTEGYLKFISENKKNFIKRAQHDIAILKLKTAFTASTTFLKLSKQLPDQGIKQDVYNCSYHYTGDNRVKLATNHNVEYTPQCGLFIEELFYANHSTIKITIEKELGVHLSHGMSGGPIITNNNELIGLVSGGINTNIHDILISNCKHVHDFATYYYYLQDYKMVNFCNEIINNINKALEIITPQKKRSLHIWTPITPFKDWIESYMGDTETMPLLEFDETSLEYVLQLMSLNRLVKSYKRTPNNYEFHDELTTLIDSILRRDYVKNIK